MEATSSRLGKIGSGTTSAASFTDFVRANTSTLLKTAHLLTGSTYAAEELVQDTLVRLYARWSRVQTADVPLAYVQRSLTNNFLDQRRHAGRELVTDVLPEPADRRDAEIEFADRDVVWALLRTLGPRQRAALVLRFYDDLSDADIARHLGCRPSTVRSLTRRALAKLRRRLAP